MGTPHDAIAGAEASQGWGASYPIWSKAIEQRGLRVGAELGIGYGGNAEYMLGNTSVDKLYGVDPFLDWHFDSDALYLYVCNRLAPYRQRYQHIRKPAEDAVHDVPGELDFIYVDHNHTYDGMMRFFHDWLPKLRVGGIIGGDGYCGRVKRAVDEVCQQHRWEVVEEAHRTFWFEKGSYLWLPVP